MFFKKKSFLLFTLLLVLSVALVGCGGGSEQEGAESEYHWRIALEESQGSVQDAYAQEFAKRLEEKSEGKIKLDVYQYGQLGSMSDQVELLQDGGLEFAMISPGNTGTIVPESQIFALQFLFTDDMAVNQEVLNTSEALNKDLTELYLEKNIMPLAYWTEGFLQWTANKPLTTLDSFNGLKIRTMQSPLIVKSYEAYGANPTPMDWAELYIGLQQKTVEGQENPLFFIEDEGFYEVQDYLTLSRHNIYITTTAVNPSFFNKLPEDIQDLIVETVDEMRSYGFDIQNDFNAERLEMIRNNKDYDTEIVELNKEQREAFKEASLPVRDFFVQEYEGKSQEILDKLTAEIEEAQNKDIE